MKSVLQFADRPTGVVSCRWTLNEPETTCNHPPTVIVNGHDTNEPLFVDVKTSETITLDASESFDVDGDKLEFEWFQYKEADYCLPVSLMEYACTP
jgi:hypothetical protein